MICFNKKGNVRKNIDIVTLKINIFQKFKKKQKDKLFPRVGQTNNI